MPVVTKKYMDEEDETLYVIFMTSNLSSITDNPTRERQAWKDGTGKKNPRMKAS
jgi:hypothetical protein